MNNFTRRQMNMKTKLCDNCNSEIVTVKRGNRFVTECSYCGESVEKGTVIEDFIPEYSRDNE
jgi:ribosomal protein L37AE/L43A